MKKQQILEAIKMLAKSQGMWGRLYTDLMNREDGYDTVLQYLEDQNFTDVVDLVMFIEG